MIHIIRSDFPIWRRPYQLCTMCLVWPLGHAVCRLTVPGYARGGTKRIITKRMSGSLKRHVFVSSMSLGGTSGNAHDQQGDTSDKGGPARWVEERLTDSGLAGSELEVVRVRDGLLMVKILSDERMMKAEVRWAGCWDGQLSTAWQSLRGSDGGGRRLEDDSRCSS